MRIQASEYTHGKVYAYTATLKSVSDTTTAKLRRGTARLLKIEAAKRDVKLVDLLDHVILDWLERQDDMKEEVKTKDKE